MGFRALVNRRKWGGTNEHAMLVRGTEPGLGHTWRSCLLTQPPHNGPVESSCEGMMKSELSYAEHAGRSLPALLAGL